MFKYANLNNIIFNNNNDTYKVFGINYLTNLIISHSYQLLKDKYKPPKYYNSDNILIKQLENKYYDEQLYLNPYLQIKYLIDESIKYYNSLFVVQVYEDNIKPIRIYNTKQFNGSLIDKIYRKLNKIYKYRNNMYFNELYIDDIPVYFDDLDPESLEQIYNIKPDYILDVSNNLEMNMSNDHPFFENFVTNTKEFYIYLLEYQMNFNFEIFDMCWKYLHDYIINDLKNCDPKNYNNNKTYYINPNDKFQIVESENKNKFTFITDINSYYNIELVYKFRYNDINYELKLNSIKPKYNIKLKDIYEFSQKKYGCVLNFGAEYFYVPYMDFLDDYKLVI